MGIRRNQKRLSKAEKDRFIAALFKMKNTPAASYAYDKYEDMHEQAFAGGPHDPDTNPAHFGPAFLPWHREFLRRFEKDLQDADKAVGKDGKITLPYWDWTRANDPSDTTKPAGKMFAADFMGPNGVPVGSGHFKAGSWSVVQRGLPPSNLIRAYGDPLLGAPPFGLSLPSHADVMEALALEGLDFSPWDDTVGMGTSVASPAMTLAKGAAGGSLAAGEYLVCITYQNAGETLPSRSRKVCLGAACSPANTNKSIEVPSPAAVAGATQYNVFVTAPGGAAGTETLQAGPIAIGTPTTITTIVAGRVRPTINTTSSFRNVLEGAYNGPSRHNLVHVWVGGTGGAMGGAHSPNDPLFFLHHCNIDRLWALWQFHHPGQHYPAVVPKRFSVGNRPMGLNDAMPPWTTKPIDVLNHTTLGYTYDSDPPGMIVVTP